jgi:hypothetical protein
LAGWALTRGGTLVLLSGKNNVKRRKNTSKAKGKKKQKKQLTNSLIIHHNQLNKYLTNTLITHHNYLNKMTKDKTHHEFFLKNNVLYNPCIEWQCLKPKP